VDEAASLLGENRASIYRSIGRGDFPLPVFRINGRMRVVRRSVERLLAGEWPPDREGGVVKGGPAGEPSERTLEDPGRELLARHDGSRRPWGAGLPRSG